MDVAGRPPAVIPSLLSGQALSAAKDLRWAQGEILRCAQDDIRAEVNASGGDPTFRVIYVLPSDTPQRASITPS